MKLLYKILISLTLGLYIGSLSAQINIGALEPPASGALLQMKEIDPNTNHDQTVLNKGILLPRINLVSTTSLEPTVAESASDYDAQKLLHVGMMVFNLTENSSGLQKGAYLWTGSEWQYMLTISEDLNLEVSPREILLASGLNSQTIEDSQINTAWIPLTNDCLVELKKVLNGGIEFENSFTLPTLISGGNAAINLLAGDIKPLVQENIDINPFYEKCSTINFTVSDASGSRTEVVTIRQFHNNMIIEGFNEEDHTLGKTYSLRVRSNGAWKVTIGGETGLIDQHIPIRSEADIIGTTFKYTLSNDDNFEGKQATITFSSVDGKYPDQTFTIRGVREYPNSYFVKPGSTMEIPIRKAYQVWQDKLNKQITGTLTAELLWQDRQSMVTDVNLMGNDIKAKMSITTNPAIVKQTLKEYAEPIGSGIVNSWEEDTPMTGNAVVVLKEDGVIRWSWHLWITEYNPDISLAHEFPKGTSDSLAVDNGMVYSYFNTKENFVLMDRHIGSVTTDVRSDLHRAYNFQWGRKDLFTPGLNAASSGYASKAIYDIDNNILPEPTGVHNPDNPLTSIYKGNGVVKEIVSNTIAECYLEESIMNPLTLYIGVAENDYDWYGSVVDQYDDYLWHTADGKKTLYDPCPLGWKVPTGGFGPASPWYGLPILKYKAQPYNLAILDYRPSGFGLWTRESARSNTTGGINSAFNVLHGKAVGALCYTTQFSNTINNSSYPEPRSKAAPVRCVRDDNALK